MNNFLAGAAAAATVVLAAAAGWFAWQAWSDAPAPPPSTSDPTAMPAAARITRLAQAAPADSLIYRGTDEAFARRGQGYVVTFETAAPAAPDGDDAALRTGWQARFCTDALRQAMREEGVQVVSGRVIAPSGRTRYVADCAPQGRPAAPAGPGGPLL